MKKLLFLMIGSFFINYSQTPSYVPSNGLIGWWPLDGNGQDLSINNRHLNEFNLIPSEDRNGIPNNALSFNGVDSYLTRPNIGHIFGIQFSNFTISLWIKKTDNSDGTAIMSGQDLSTDFIWRIDTNSNLSRFGSSFNGSSWLWTNSTNYNINEWEHLVVIISSGSRRIYKNGVQVSTSFYSQSNPLANQLPIWIGKGIDDLYFNGQIDDIGIWNRALNENEICALYRSTTNSPCPVPTNLYGEATSHYEGYVAWTELGSATKWEVKILPNHWSPPSNCLPINENSYLVTSPIAYFTSLEAGTNHYVYVRSLCGLNQPEDGVSNWSDPYQITALPSPYICGLLWNSSSMSNNGNGIVTLCPDFNGQKLQVAFSQFNFLEEYNRLYIYDGPSQYSPQISSPNGVGLGPCNNESGGWWGNQLENHTITSTDDSGCLTFKLCRSDQGQAIWNSTLYCIYNSQNHHIYVIPFIDFNNNGIKENTEPNFLYSQLNYEINGNGIINQSESLFGSYGFTIPNVNSSFNYNFTLGILNDYQNYYNISAPNNQNVSFNQPGQSVIYFPVTPQNNYEDLKVYISANEMPRAGFNYKNTIKYTNLSHQTLSTGTLNFIKDENLTILNISDTNAVLNTDGFTLNFNNLLPFQTKIINITFQVPSIPTVSIGQLISNSATILPLDNDITPSNNTSILNQNIIAAYDPNDKIEVHGREININDFDVSTDELTYTIRFENLGNASAINVRITDILDSQIDETSVRMVDASHNHLFVRNNNQLEWFFNNIYLPVSVANSPIGKGHLTFKAKLKPVIQLGSIVPNYASIYFDTNPPIVTDVFETEFVEPLYSSEFHTNFSIYPNPTHDLVNIKSKNFINRWQILDIQGKILSSNQVEASTQLQIDLSQFKSGFYLMKVFTNEGEAAFKLIKK